MSTCKKYYSIYIIHYTQLFLYYFHKFEIVSRATTIYTIIQFNLINLKLNKKKEIKLGKREREREKKREEKSN